MRVDILHDFIAQFIFKIYSKQRNYYEICRNAAMTAMFGCGPIIGINGVGCGPGFGWVILL